MSEEQQPALFEVGPPVEAPRDIEAEAMAVFNHWLEIAQPRVRTLTPSRDRVFRRAVREAGVELCIDGLDGMVDYSRGRGQQNFDYSRVFVTRPGGSPLLEQIEWFAKQRKSAPSAGADKAALTKRIQVAIDVIRFADEHPERRSATISAQAEEKRLNVWGYAVVRDENGKFLKVEKL